jgi:hypothetical protein
MNVALLMEGVQGADRRTTALAGAGADLDRSWQRYTQRGQHAAPSGYTELTSHA